MFDHATWVSFTTEELTNLKEALHELPPTFTSALLDRIEQYETPEAIDPAFRAAAEDLDWAGRLPHGKCTNAPPVASKPAPSPLSM